MRKVYKMFILVSYAFQNVYRNFICLGDVDTHGCGNALDYGTTGWTTQARPPRNQLRFRNSFRASEYLPFSLINGGFRMETRLVFSIVFYLFEIHLSSFKVLLGISTLLYYVPVHLAALHQSGSLTLLSFALWFGNEIKSKRMVKVWKLRKVHTRIHRGGRRGYILYCHVQKKTVTA